jgi:tRNA pseudouridine32 synthase / 23S rRNA pseudouridine746 synthase
VLPIHIDEHLVVLDKPAGLLTVPGRTEPDCLAARAQRLWPDARVVHRLDQATSGLVLMARGTDMQRRLSAAFESRQVLKRYLAVVHGLPADEGGTIKLPLAADWPRRPRQQVDLQRGKPSVTHWQVLRRDAASGCSLLALTPVTGRSHQLRVHLLAIGHPIVGDTLYDQAPADRLMLHAAELALQHPATGQPCRWRSAAPFGSLPVTGDAAPV